MDASSGSTRKSTANKPDEGQEGHGPKRLRLAGGLEVSVDTMDFVYQDVHICGEMHATTTHDIIAMTAEEYSDLEVKTEVESIQHWKANLLMVKIMYRTNSGEILDRSKVEKVDSENWV